MTQNEPREPELTLAELEEQVVTELPDREAMSLFGTPPGFPNPAFPFVIQGSEETLPVEPPAEA